MNLETYKLEFKKKLLSAKIILAAKHNIRTQLARIKTGSQLLVKIRRSSRIPYNPIYLRLEL